MDVSAGSAPRVALRPLGLSRRLGPLRFRVDRSPPFKSGGRIPPRLSANTCAESVRDFQTLVRWGAPDTASGTNTNATKLFVISKSEIGGVHRYRIWQEHQYHELLSDFQMGRAAAGDG